MTWLAPWALVAGAAAAIGVALLHLLARDRPPRYVLPTARFVSPGSARATRRARAPRDVPLLLLRVLAILIAGAAIAGPVLEPRRGSVGRIVLLDASAGAPDLAAAVDSARARLGAGGRLVLFDSLARPVPPASTAATLDSLAHVAAGDVTPRPQGSLSAGLVAALRVASEVAHEADSVALVVVSPLRGVEDAATMDLRALWPGRTELVELPVPAGQEGASAAGESSDDRKRPPLAVRGPAGDGIVAAARLIGALPAGRMLSNPRAPDPATLLVRDAPTGADSAFARAGGTLVLWPAADGPAGTSTAPAPADIIGGFVVGDVPVLFAAERRGAPPAGAVLARWVDGEPAITQMRIGSGCIRTAAIAIPARGDLTLGPAFQRALGAIVSPCATVTLPAASDSLRASLARDGALALARPLRAAATRSPATPWLLGAAIALLLIEPLIRRARGAAPGAEVSA